MSYPDEIYTPRTMENLPGLTLDVADTKNLYAEDYNGTTQEIIDIENTLGLNPEGAFADVKTRLDDTDTHKIADNVAGQITPLTNKYPMANNDAFIIEDTANGNIKKKTTLYYLFYSLYTLIANAFFNGSKLATVMLQGQGMMSAPADSTTYYVGHPGWGVSTSASFSPIGFYSDMGYVNRVHVRLERGGTTASSENSSVYLRINSTDYLISSSVKLGYAQFIDFDSNYIGALVEYGDTIQLKIVTPAWATNPTNVNVVFEVVIHDKAEVE